MQVAPTPLRISLSPLALIEVSWDVDVAPASLVGRAHEADVFLVSLTPGVLSVWARPDLIADLDADISEAGLDPKRSFGDLVGITVEVEGLSQWPQLGIAVLSKFAEAGIHIMAYTSDHEMLRLVSYGRFERSRDLVGIARAGFGAWQTH